MALTSGVAIAQLTLVDEISQLSDFDGIDTGAWSPDGLHFYAAAPGANTLTLITRSEDGLTAAQLLHLDEGATEGLQGVNALAVSPDGLHVYATARSIATFARDPVSGELTFASALFEADGDNLSSAEDVAISPDGAHVYVRQNRDIFTFAREQATGALTFVDTLSEFSLGSFSSGRIRVSPDGSHAYANGDLRDRFYVLSRDGATGQLTTLESLQDVDNARAFELSPDGQNVYVLATGDDALLVFDRDGPTGALTLVQTVTGTEDQINGLGDPLAISPDGAMVYVGVDSDDEFVAVYNRAANGMLSFGSLQAVGNHSWIGVNPGGMSAHVISPAERSVRAFERNTMDGSLTLTSVLDMRSEVIGLNQPSALAAHPSGSTVYTAGTNDNAIGVFAIDRPENMLRFVEAQIDGENHVTGLAGVNDVEVAPDGLHLYAVGRTSDRIVTFQINGLDNELQFVQSRPAPGLDGPKNLAISDCGRFVYATSTNADAIVVFERDFLTGYLLHIQTVQEGVDGVLGLDRPDDLAIAGPMLFSALSFTQDLAVFERDVEGGLLTFREVVAGPEGSKAGSKGSDDRSIVAIPYGAAKIDDDLQAGQIGVLVAGASPEGTVRYAFDAQSFELTVRELFSDTGYRVVFDQNDILIMEAGGIVARFAVNPNTGETTEIVPSTTVDPPPSRGADLGSLGTLLASNFFLNIGIEDPDGVRRDIAVNAFYERGATRAVGWYAQNVGTVPITADLVTRGHAVSGNWEVTNSNVPGLAQGTMGSGELNRLTVSFPVGAAVRFTYPIVAPGPSHQWVVRALPEGGDDHLPNDCRRLPFPRTLDAVFATGFEPRSSGLEAEC